MTALEQYVRLEAAGRWRETPRSDWREVLVSFGNASLVLSDFKERPLTHWSLAAVARIDKGEGPALYAPDAGTAEQLEIADAEMIAAIAEVSRMVRRRARPQTRRGVARWAATGLAAAALLGAAAYWGPDLLRDRAFGLISPEQAGLVAERIRTRLEGQACATPEGTRSLRRMGMRATPGTRLEVMEWERPLLAVLPDGAVLLGRPLVERSASAETVAGWAALGAVAGTRASPLYRWVLGLDAGAVLGFVISGDIAWRDVTAMSEDMTTARFAPDAGLVAKAAAALVARDIDPAPFLADIARRYPALPLPDTSLEGAAPVMPRDQDWVALQNICSG